MLSISCEPLHLKNNVCEELFVKLWKVLYACVSFDKCKSYKDIPANNIFRKFVYFLQKDMSTKCFGQENDKLVQ